MKVAVLRGLMTRDGRRAVEIRRATPLNGESFYANPKHTIYSCAFEAKDSTAENIAIKRAADYCKKNNLIIVSFIGPTPENPNPRAILQ